jgi:hypothetical protein
MAKNIITRIDIDVMGKVSKKAFPSLTYRLVIHRGSDVKVGTVTPKGATRLHQWLLKNGYEMGIPQATDIWFYIPYRLVKKDK